MLFVFFLFYPTATSQSSTENLTRAKSATLPNSHKPLPSLVEDLSQSARSSSVSTTTSSSSQPSTTSDPLDHLLAETLSTDSFISSSNRTTPSKKYRDGLESENFVNKLARFEYFKNSQHSRPPPVLPFPTVNSVVYGDGQCFSDNSDSNASKNNKEYQEHYRKDGTSQIAASSSTSKLSSNMARPSVSFNRSDHGYNSHLFYSSKNQALGETVSLNSTSTVVSTPESSSGSYSSGCTTNTDRHTYRRAGGGGTVTFFDDYANLGANATPSPASMDYDEDSSLINQYSSSLPSPDSLSSMSNHRPYVGSSMGNSNSMDSANSRTACNGSPTLSTSTTDFPSPNSTSGASMSLGESGTHAGETLMELRKKQVSVKEMARLCLYKSCLV